MPPEPSLVWASSTSNGTLSHRSDPDYVALEQAQIVVALPLRDLLVGLLPVATLAAHVVVEVVLVADRAERLAQHVAGLGVVRGLEQVRGQRLDPELRPVLGRGLIHVQRHRIAGIESALDPV